MSRSDHVHRNREAWNSWAGDYAGFGHRNWARGEPTWGIWGLPESEAGMLPADPAGLEVVELGCGTAYVSAWLARLGARPVGVDSSPAQLATARRLQAEFDLPFPLIWADAEHVPLADGCADAVVSEYGASLWCEPDRWLAEAGRLLRPGGHLSFLVSSPLITICAYETEAEGPASPTMQRDYFGLHRVEWPDDDSVEFHLGHGEMVAALRRHGFVIEALRELRAPPDATSGYVEHVDAAWASRWPSEEVWVATKA